MNRADQGRDPLAKIFAERPTRPSSTEPDPTADEVWDAATGQLAPDETLALLDRTVDDPRLAMEWRLARELGAHVAARDDAGARTESEDAPWEGDDQGRAGQGPPSRWPSRWRAALPWAASLLLTLGALVYLVWPEVDPPVFRNPEATPIESLLAPEVEVDHADTLLRWRGPEGARFEVSVLRQDNLTQIFHVTGIAESQITLPATVLDTVPPGVVLLWRVEAVLDHGERIRSATFRMRVREKQ